MFTLFSLCFFKLCLDAYESNLEIKMSIFPLTHPRRTRLDYPIEKGNDAVFVYEKGTGSLRNVLRASAYVTRVAEGKGPNYLLGLL